MAKIIEDTVLIRFSKIARDSEDDEQVLVSEEIETALEQVAQELAGSGIVVEVVSME